MIVIAIVIKLTSAGPIIFKQQRVGRNGIDFTIYKFRTMYVEQPIKSLLTLGDRDSRVTIAGYWLRKYKLDEIPQLFNVLKNDMSFVGPRPELRHYVNQYTPEQATILRVKPGITDYASIRFRNESVILASQQNPEAFYIQKILPIKIELNRQYAENPTLWKYFLIIFTTGISLFKR